MTVCHASDIDDLEVKQEPMEGDQVKLEESPPGLKSEDPSRGSHPNTLADTQLPRVTESGKVYIVEWGIHYTSIHRISCMQHKTGKC